MVQNEVSDIIKRISELELQAKAVATSIEGEKNKLRLALEASEAGDTNTHQSAEHQPASFRAGDRVSFQATDSVPAGTGLVLGHTRGKTPFLRIKRDGATSNDEVVHRKPHTVKKLN